MSTLFLLDGRIQIDSFIGATDEETEGTWLWLDGSPWGYENWGSNEPNYGEKENCIQIELRDTAEDDPGWWGDLECSRSEGYICSYYNSKCVFFITLSIINSIKACASIGAMKWNFLPFKDIMTVASRPTD